MRRPFPGAPPTGPRTRGAGPWSTGALRTVHCRLRSQNIGSVGDAHRAEDRGGHAGRPPAAPRVLPRGRGHSRHAHGAHVDPVALLERDRLAHQRLALHVTAEASVPARSRSAPRAAASRDRAGRPRADCLSTTSPRGARTKSGVYPWRAASITRTSAISSSSFRRRTALAASRTAPPRAGTTLSARRASPRASRPPLW